MLFTYINKLCHSFSLWKTLYINFKALPFEQAVKLPIIVGRRVTLQGIHKGCIIIKGTNIRRGCIHLSVQTTTPIFNVKRECSILRCKEHSTIIFEIYNNQKTTIRSGFSILNGGRLHIGPNFLANQHCTFVCFNEMYFGKNCRIGWNCQFMDTDMHIIYNIENDCFLNPNGKVFIGDNVWFANSCFVQKNSMIPSYSIVSCNSLVNKSFSDIKSHGNLFAGIPAKLRRTGIVRVVGDSLEERIRTQFGKDDSPVFNIDFNYDYQKQ